MTQSHLMRPTEAFADLGRIPFDRTPLAQSLSEIAEVAKRTVPGADEVSVTLLGPGGAHTAAFTGACAVLLDEWQYENGYGPCLGSGCRRGRSGSAVSLSKSRPCRAWLQITDRRSLVDH